MAWAASEVHSGRRRAGCGACAASVSLSAARLLPAGLGGRCCRRTRQHWHLSRCLVFSGVSLELALQRHISLPGFPAWRPVFALSFCRVCCLSRVAMLEFVHIWISVPRVLRHCRFLFPVELLRENLSHWWSRGHVIVAFWVVPHGSWEAHSYSRSQNVYFLFSSQIPLGYR